MANLGDKKYPLKEWILFFVWKTLYVFLLIVLPVLMGYPFEKIIIAFFVMHIADSLFFIPSLIATHLCMETQFPRPDKDGFLPHDYFTHQLATSLDFSPNNHFLIGFLAALILTQPIICILNYPILSILILHRLLKKKQSNLMFSITGSH